MYPIPALGLHPFFSIVSFALFAHYFMYSYVSDSHLIAYSSAVMIVPALAALSRAHFKTVLERRSSKPVVQTHETSERETRSVSRVGESFGAN